MEVYKKCPLKKRPIIVNDECTAEEPEDLSFKRNHKRGEQRGDIKRHFDLSSNSYYDSIRKTNEFGFWYKSLTDTLQPDHQLPLTSSGISNEIHNISAFKTYHNPTHSIIINQQYDTLPNIHLRGLTNLEMNNFHYDPYLNSNNLNFYPNEMSAAPTTPSTTTEQLNYTKDYIKDYNGYNLTPPSSPASVISSASEPEDLSTRNGEFLIDSLLYSSSPSSSVSSSRRYNIGNWKNPRLYSKQLNKKIVDQYHSQSQPTQIYRFQCDKCQKSYSTSTGLSKHQQLHCPAAECNKIKKEFCCKSCDKVYTSLGALKMHIRTHTLPCKCPHCGKAFSRPWLLQGHIRTHTGEKPFSCSHCQRAFADRSNLRAHQQTHVEVKKYICENCSKSFSRMSLLTKHVAGGCCGIQLQSYI